MRNFRALGGALIAALLIGLTACSSLPAGVNSTPAPGEVSSELAPYYQQVLTWKSCRDGLECTTAIAPLDWAHPAGKTISLALIRHRAPAKTRQGSLFVNPGGPGASGVKFIRDSLDYAVDKTLIANFDVIGFDPRGVGDSTPVRCYNAKQMDIYLYGLAKAARGTSAALAESVAEAKAFANACLANTGDLLAHVDSISAARDLDMLRNAVGDSKLNYLGYSYGSFLGAMYAQTFPHKVGRLVLDGAVDPSVSNDAGIVTQAKGFEMALGNYLAWCLKQSDCPFSGSVTSAKLEIRSVLERVDSKPLKASDGRLLGADALATGIIAPLYSQSSWTYLSQLFTDLLVDNNPDTAFALADWYNERDSDGTYLSNQTEAFTAVTCLDAPAAPRANWQRNADELKRVAPTIGVYFAFGEVGCSVWPVPAVLTPARLGPTGPSPILVIGTTGDPATPISWADGLVKQLTNGRLIRYTGEGHTGYNRGSSCVNKIVDDYLTGSKIPDRSSTC